MLCKSDKPSILLHSMRYPRLYFVLIIIIIIEGSSLYFVLGYVFFQGFPGSRLCLGFSIPRVFQGSRLHPGTHLGRLGLGPAGLPCDPVTAPPDHAPALPYSS